MESVLATAPSAGGVRSEEIRLELVNKTGHTVGTAEKLAAHQPPGRLHRAFSVFLFDRLGNMLLQRRAAAKYHSPGVWSNSCCGHPLPGEPPLVAAARRISQELGQSPTLLQEAGTVTYVHDDPTSGLVEQEFNHLFTGVIEGPLRPDPDEIAATTFVDARELARLRRREPFSAWFPTVLQAAFPAICQTCPGWHSTDTPDEGGSR
ncbi:isopentenyl-diphosphate Delta-isomerase [Streptomyces sp. NPDC048419]|uniref:isopentenyl-diphosphate Delta-isomerase n=1 Tax=Streptomyces sp. NPDC048419 TaxID=3365547 RepID=UPI003713B540